MLRKIVDFKKLTEDILNLLVEKFPDGYDETDVISFRNAQNEIIEAVEVRTDDTIYLVKVGKRLVQAMEDFGDDDSDTDEDFDEVKVDDADADLGDDDDEDVEVKKVKPADGDDNDDDDDMDDTDSDYDEDDEDEDDDND